MHQKNSFFPQPARLKSKDLHRSQDIYPFIGMFEVQSVNQLHDLPGVAQFGVEVMLCVPGENGD
jgi:hypothetical protein